MDRKANKKKEFWRDTGTKVTRTAGVAARGKTTLKSRRLARRTASNLILSGTNELLRSQKRASKEHAKKRVKVQQGVMAKNSDGNPVADEKTDKRTPGLKHLNHK